MTDIQQRTFVTWITTQISIPLQAAQGIEAPLPGMRMTRCLGLGSVLVTEEGARMKLIDRPRDTSPSHQNVPGVEPAISTLQIEAWSRPPLGVERRIANPPSRSVGMKWPLLCVKQRRQRHQDSVFKVVGSHQADPMPRGGVEAGW